MVDARGAGGWPLNGDGGPAQMGLAVPSHVVAAVVTSVLDAGCCE